MKRIICACLATLTHTTAATAQQWTQDTADGARVAAIVAENAELRVTCAPVDGGIQNALSLTLAGTSVEGDVNFAFDSGEVTAAFTAGQLMADLQTNAALFADITARLRNDNTVQVTDAAGASSSFSLRGSGNAIGECPLPDVPFTMDNCQTDTGLAYVRTDDGVSLGDVCVDRANGSVTGLFTVDGLTLESDDGVDTAFAADAKRLDIAPELSSPYHAGRVEDGSPAFVYADETTQAVGFLYGPVTSSDAVEETFFATVRSGDIGLIGVADVSNGSTTIALVEDPASATTQSGSGSVTLTVDADGAVTGSGTLQANTEGGSVDLSLDTLRGFAVGETGQVIKTFAVAAGQATDADGTVRDVTVPVEIFLFATTIWDE